MTHTDPVFKLGLPVRLGLAVLAGLLLTAGYALHPLWWAPWLAPLVLILAGAGSPGQARLAGGIAGAVAMASVLTYYVDMTFWPIACLFVVLRAASWAFAARLAHMAAQRLTPALAMLVLPATISGLEVLTLTLSPHGAAGSLAYSQMDMPALVQIASIGGPPAVVFMILLPGSFFGIWLTRRPALKPLMAATGTFLALTAGLTAFTVIRLDNPPANTLPVTMLATDRFPGIPEDWSKVWTVYSPAVTANARAGGLVVLPEKIALVDGAGAAQAAKDVSAVAMAAHATIVVGIEIHDGGIYRNRALIAGPDGRLAWYDKQRMVPVFEDRDVPGKTPLFIDVANTRLGVAICKDMHIPSIGREYAGTAAVLAVPAWDFGRDGWMGARMTMMRGIEGGYAIARSSRNGLVGAYDATGRILAESRSSDGMTVVTGAVPTGRRDTLYSHIGNASGWLCLLGTIALQLWSWTRRSAAAGGEMREPQQ